MIFKLKIKIINYSLILPCKNKIIVALLKSIDWTMINCMSYTKKCTFTIIIKILVIVIKWLIKM
jgi:hypothetical protein